MPDQNSSPWDSMFASTVGNVANGLTGGILGMALQGWNNQNQINQQEKLNALNLDQAQKLSAMNESYALDFWNKTNYSAQVDQLEKAGLNPALLYSKGGPGGQTLNVGGQPGNSQANAGGGEVLGMAMQMEQLQLMRAQKANIDADTQAKEADANQKNTLTPTQNTNIQTQTESLAQGIQNQKAAQALTEMQTKIAQIDFDYAGASFADRLDLLSQQARQMTGMATSALVQGGVDEATKNTKIQSIKQGLVQQFLTQELTRSDTQLVNSQTTLTQKQAANIAEQMTLEYMKLSNMKDQTAIDAELANFKTDPMVNAAETLGQLIHIVPLVGAPKVNYSRR